MIGFFKGHWESFSNFSRDPVGGFPSGEHAFQAKKSKNLAEQAKFKNPNMTAGQAKRAGRKIEMSDEELEAWNNGGSEEAMAEVIGLKFRAGTSLAELLISSGDQELVEGNTWHDNIWGNCVCPNCEGIEGRNLLGKTLMAQRTVLNAEALAAAN